MGDGVVKAFGGADVASENGAIPASRVSPGEEFAADAGILHQAGGLDGRNVERTLVVIKLANDVVATIDLRPAQEGVGLELHGTFALDNTTPLVVRLHCGAAYIRRICGERFFLDLKEKRIFAAVSLEVDAVVAETHRTGADDLEGYIDHPVLRQKSGGAPGSRLSS